MFVLLGNKIYNKEEIVRVFPKYSINGEYACILLEKKNKEKCDLLIEDIEERNVEKVMKDFCMQLNKEINK